MPNTRVVQRPPPDGGYTPGDAYRSVLSDDDAGVEPDEGPVVTGTLFLMLVLLMLILGFWAIMYMTLLSR